jgi:rod shape-determining protein MreC
MDAYFNKQKTAFFKVLFGLIFLFVFFGTLNLFHVQIKSSFYLISKPIEKIFWKAGGNSSVFLRSFFNGGNLEKENQNLKAENQKLLLEISFLQDAQKKEQAEEDALTNCSQDNFELLLADVIGLNTNSDVISIDKGSIDGILEGMPAINQQKILFGKVSKVYKNFSEITLISNKNNVLDVKVLQSDASKAPVYGAIKGKGGLSIYLDLVPTDAEIKEGDVLITSALEGAFPKNLLVGKIVKKEKNDQKPFQQAEVEPFYNIKGLENLFIITDYKKE